MSKYLEKFKTNQLRDDEEIKAHVDGYIGKLMGQGADTQHNGVLVLTNDRVVFYSKGWLNEVVRSIQLKQIANVHYTTSWPGTSLEIVSKDTLKVTTLGSKELFSEFQKQLEIARDVGDNNENQNSSKNNSLDIPDQIQKLANLRDQGLITEEEFSSKKAELLSKM